MVDQPIDRPLRTHRTTQTEKMHIDIQASSGIQTHDPSIGAGKDSSCRDHTATVIHAKVVLQA